MGKEQGTQTANQEPWGPAQGSLRFGLGELNRIYQAMNPGSMAPGGAGMGSGFTRPQYGGPQFGDPRQPSNPYGRPGGQIGAIGGPLSQPQQMGAQSPYQLPDIKDYGLLDPAAAEMLATIRGDKLFSNPNLDEVIRRASADVNSQFSGMGRYGSGSHLDQLFSKAAAPIRYADYAQERQNQLSAIGQAPGFSMAPYQMYSARQAAPYEGLRNYLDLAMGVGGQGGSQSSPIYKNPIAGAAGGALAGSALASGLGATVAWPYLLGGALLGGFG